MTGPTPRLDVLTGRDAIAPAIAELARLRIDVFRAWPYLYEGSLDYETNYLSAFANSDDAVLVAAHAGTRMVGASTGIPMAQEHDAFVAPLTATGIDVESVFYCAESVLQPEWRGHGLYRGFFDAREAHARSLGCSTMVFCGVVRPDDHPARPEHDRPLDPIWRRFGYTPLDGAIARFRWTDIGETAPTEKPMQMWIKSL